MGPTTKAISVTGGVTFEQLRDDYRTQALGLTAGGADYLLLETCQDTRNVKAGLIGIEEAFGQLGWRLPVAVSVTIETMGTMLGGQEVEALAASLLHRDRRDLLYVGLNCATGPDQMFDHLRALSEICRTRVACVPNAGLPDEDGLYTQTAEDFRAVSLPFPRSRLAEPRRRLLRHDHGTHRDVRRPGAWAVPAAARRARPLPGFGS